MNAGWIVILMGCSTQSNEPEQEIADEEALEEGWADEESNCPKSWVLTYALDGVLDVSHTPMDMGNGSAIIGGTEEDELIIRIADDNGVPGDGRVLLTSFNLHQYISISIDMFGEYTISSDLFSQVHNECGSAVGILESNELKWAECTYGENHGSTAWTPEEGAAGLGCINNYHVQGNIECIDETPLGTCADGWLEDGTNLQDYVYNQPLLNLEFTTDDLSHFVMHGNEYGVEIPTYSNNRTWLSLEGTLKDSRLEDTPSCLCD